jgi:hypothetical protein
MMSRHTLEYKEQMVALREFSGRVRKPGLKLKPSKCEIGLKEVRFLGHQLGEVLFPCTDTISRILEAPRPETVKQLRSFLGLVGWYRKFVHNFAELAAPLTDLTAKGCPHVIDWQAPQEQAFVSLKNHVASPPVLASPYFSRPFILQTDASDIGVGAILLQEGDDGMKHPIAFASR